jgi:hypothetical protein
MDKTDKNSNNHANQTKGDKFKILVMEQSWNKSQNSAENNQKYLLRTEQCPPPGSAPTGRGRRVEKHLLL